MGSRIIEMSEDSDFYREHREAQQERRAKRVPIRTAEILAIKDKGFKIEQKTDYHFRVNDRLDLYPTHNCWHDTKTNRRGGTRNLAEFTIYFFKNNGII
jgi:hypothetical protein